MRIGNLVSTLCVVALGIVVACTAQALEISGLVTGDDGGSPIANVRVQIYQQHPTYGYWYNLGAITTGADGTYRFIPLSDGLYRLWFDASATDYLSEAYDDVPSIYDSDATSIVISDSVAVSNINASLSIGLRIHGTVTALDGGAPLQNMTVEAYQWNGWRWSYAGSAWTEANGQYVLRRLLAGSHRVVFRDHSGQYAPVVYDGIPGESYEATGSNVVLTAGGSVSNINASLPPAGEISGRVFDADGGMALEGAYVNAYSLRGGAWSWAGSAGTDSSGNYSLGGLAAGTHRVVFYGDYLVHVNEVYDDQHGTDYSSYGTDIDVPVGGTVSNINATLERYGSIGGTVTASGGSTPIPGARVYLYSGSNDMYSSVTTGIDGSYEVSLVNPGSYTATAAPPSGSGHLGQWYGGGLYIPGEHSSTTATAIALSSGEERSDVDFSLDPAGRIYGVVQDEGGDPISGAVVSGMNNTYGQTYYANTDATGGYAVVDLMPGTTLVKVEADGYADEWWEDVDHSSQASSVSMSSGSEHHMDSSRPAR